MIKNISLYFAGWLTYKSAFFSFASVQHLLIARLFACAAITFYFTRFFDYAKLDVAYDRRVQKGIRLFLKKIPVTRDCSGDCLPMGTKIVLC